MLEHNHITYDLLWVLFRPRSHVYTPCFVTGELRWVVFDAGEETTDDDVTSFYVAESVHIEFQIASLNHCCLPDDPVVSQPRYKPWVMDNARDMHYSAMPMGEFFI